MHELRDIYTALGDDKVSTTQGRCENAIFRLVNSKVEVDLLNRVPLGMAAPIREAARTCQLAPPGNWPLEAYQIIGRNDLAASASEAPESLHNDSYRPIRDFIVSKIQMKSRYLLQ